MVVCPGCDRKHKKGGLCAKCTAVMKKAVKWWEKAGMPN